MNLDVQHTFLQRHPEHEWSYKYVKCNVYHLPAPLIVCPIYLESITDSTLRRLLFKKENHAILKRTLSPSYKNIPDSQYRFWTTITDNVKNQLNKVNATSFAVRCLWSLGKLSFKMKSSTDRNRSSSICLKHSDCCCCFRFSTVSHKCHLGGASRYFVLSYASGRMRTRRAHSEATVDDAP
jgi:hypothetical protein